jgi:hypothetical protein
MATMTAYMLVGSPHPNHGGINPSHCLFLSENSRPAWQLTPESQTSSIVWIPTVEHMLEDGLLMAGLLAVGDERLRQLAEGAFRKQFAGRVELYDDVAEEGRQALYAACRQLGPGVKIVLSVLHESSLFALLPVLAEYGFDVEVCCPVYRRETSAWLGKTVVEGSLKATS